MSKLRLRCQYGDGQRSLLDGLTEESNILELQTVIFSLTFIEPGKQRIKSGFPPKLLDTANDDMVLKDSGIRSGDTLIVEECKEKKLVPTSACHTKGTDEKNDTRKLVRKVVPADNSCLFASISFVIMSDTSFAAELRNLAAKLIADNPEIYNDAFLGKSNKEYCEWLTIEDHWGGAIELNVFSQLYEVEINVADVQSGRIDRYGETKNYVNRVFLLYDGIHYDPMGMEEDGNIVQTVFPTTEPGIQTEALSVAEELRMQRQFTDVSGFSLRCMVCNSLLNGQSQAQEHAKKTGHTNFGEV